MIKRVSFTKRENASNWVITVYWPKSSWLMDPVPRSRTSLHLVHGRGQAWRCTPSPNFKKRRKKFRDIAPPTPWPVQDGVCLWKQLRNRYFKAASLSGQAGLILGWGWASEDESTDGDEKGTDGAWGIIARTQWMPGERMTDTTRLKALVDLEGLRVGSGERDKHFKWMVVSEWERKRKAIASAASAMTTALAAPTVLAALRAEAVEQLWYSLWL